MLSGQSNNIFYNQLTQHRKEVLILLLITKHPNKSVIFINRTKYEVTTSKRVVFFEI